MQGAEGVVSMRKGQSWHVRTAQVFQHQAFSYGSNPRHQLIFGRGATLFLPNQHPPGAFSLFLDIQALSQPVQPEI
jgi:hypothetical protein